MHTDIRTAFDHMTSGHYEIRRDEKAGACVGSSWASRFNEDDSG